MFENVITANRLDDGTVIYLTRESLWSPTLADAWVAEDEDEAVVMMAAGENAENKGIVVGAYLIAAEVLDDTVVAVRLREGIRADGPTRRTDSVSVDDNSEQAHVPLR
ncbi:MAG: DUF2849 domain-containing protein [Alphaproteobacteria bacterium]|nr:DUF2849 domain-containing protein [Alphaproteobacteria bacterium]